MVTTASGGNAATLKELGADEVVDYGAVEWPEALSGQQVHALNAAIDTRSDEIGVMPQGTLDGSSDIDFHQGAELGSAAALSGTHGRGDFGGFLFEGEGGGWPAEHRQPFRELIAQPSTLRHLLTALGESTSAC